MKRPKHQNYLKVKPIINTIVNILKPILNDRNCVYSIEGCETSPTKYIYFRDSYHSNLIVRVSDHISTEKYNRSSSNVFNFVYKISDLNDQTINMVKIQFKIQKMLVWLDKKVLENNDVHFPKNMV